MYVSSGRTIVTTALLAALPNAVAGQAIHGVVSDRGNGNPVSGAMVIVLGADEVAVATSYTDDRGQYEIRLPAPGRYAVRVQHIGYELYTTTSFSLETGARKRLPVRIVSAPIALDEIRVRTRRTALHRDYKMAVGAAIVDRRELQQMADRGARVGDLAYRIPGLNITYGRFYGPGHENFRTYIACIQSSRPFPTLSRGGRPPWCDMVEVYIDDVPVSAAGMVLAHMDLNAFERAEYVPSLGASRWGLRATETGVLLLWTRRR